MKTLALLIIVGLILFLVLWMRGNGPARVAEFVIKAILWVIVICVTQPIRGYLSVRNAWMKFKKWIRKLMEKKPDWKVSRLISQDGTTIYIVRDREGSEREIQDVYGRAWVRESKAKFSFIPCFEDYHRERYRTAKPYNESETMQARDQDVRQGGISHKCETL